MVLLPFFAKQIGNVNLSVYNILLRKTEKNIKIYKNHQPLHKIIHVYN